VFSPIKGRCNRAIFRESNGQRRDGAPERNLRPGAFEDERSAAQRPTENLGKELLVAGMDEIQRGEIWWADLTERRRSEPGLRRPVLVLQADSFNRSSIQTVIVAVITSNLQVANAPGNTFLPARSSGLPRDSVVNVSQVLTLDKGFLTEHVGTLPLRLQTTVDAGLRSVLQL
jgi:mRNA interferase MazF